MATTESQVEVACAECGISEVKHRELYGTPLGVLTFTFQPDQGPTLHGHLRLCRPCTHEVLSRRLLSKAGVGAEALSPETWS
jgi:hypothetical protein